VLTFRKTKNSLGKKVRRLENIKSSRKKIVAPDHAAVTKGLNDCTPTLAEACAIQRLVIA
jgi:hypothetical protein